MGSDWDWDRTEGNPGQIAVPRVDAIAVYANDAGEIVLRQQDTLSEQDSIIILPKSCVAALVAAIQKEASVE